MEQVSNRLPGSKSYILRQRYSQVRWRRPRSAGLSHSRNARMGTNLLTGVVQEKVLHSWDNSELQNSLDVHTRDTLPAARSPPVLTLIRSDCSHSQNQGIADNVLSGPDAASVLSGVRGGVQRRSQDPACYTTAAAGHHLRARSVFHVSDPHVLRSPLRAR